MSNAYSSRSCPESSLPNIRMRVTRFMFPPGALTRRLDGAGVLVEHGLHLGAGELDRADADERNQRDEQCVLEQVLPRVVAAEAAQPCDEFHGSLLAPSRHRCVR